MHAAQDRLNHYTGRFKNCSEILGGGFYKLLFADQIKCRVAQLALSEGLCLRLSARAEVVEDMVPGALHQRGVEARKVWSGKCHPQRGPAGDLVLGLKYSLCFVLVARPETGAVT